MPAFVTSASGWSSSAVVDDDTLRDWVPVWVVSSKGQAVTTQLLLGV